MNKRYVINTETDAIWHEVCDSAELHINDKGIPIARALPDMALLIADLLNKNEENRKKLLKELINLCYGEVQSAVPYIDNQNKVYILTEIQHWLLEQLNRSS